jgi:hypothetical protein
MQRDKTIKINVVVPVPDCPRQVVIPRCPSPKYITRASAKKSKPTPMKVVKREIKKKANISKANKKTKINTYGNVLNELKSLVTQYDNVTTELTNQNIPIPLTAKVSIPDMKSQADVIKLLAELKLKLPMLLALQSQPQRAVMTPQMPISYNNNYMQDYALAYRPPFPIANGGFMNNQYLVSPNGRPMRPIQPQAIEQQTQAPTPAPLEPPTPTLAQEEQHLADQEKEQNEIKLRVLAINGEANRNSSLKYKLLSLKAELGRLRLKANENNKSRIDVITDRINVMIEKIDSYNPQPVLPIEPADETRATLPPVTNDLDKIRAEIDANKTNGSKLYAILDHIFDLINNDGNPSQQLIDLKIYAQNAIDALSAPAPAPAPPPPATRASNPLVQARINIVNQYISQEKISMKNPSQYQDIQQMNQNLLRRLEQELSNPLITQSQIDDYQQLVLQDFGTFPASLAYVISKPYLSSTSKLTGELDKRNRIDLVPLSLGKSNVFVLQVNGIKTEMTPQAKAQLGYDVLKFNADGEMIKDGDVDLSLKPDEFQEAAEPTQAGQTQAEPTMRPTPPAPNVKLDLLKRYDSMLFLTSFRQQEIKNFMDEIHQDLVKAKQDPNYVSILERLNGDVRSAVAILASGYRVGDINFAKLVQITAQGQDDSNATYRIQLNNQATMGDRLFNEYGLNYNSADQSMQSYLPLISYEPVGRGDL